jgi:integrase
VKITKRAVDAMKPGDTINDDEVKGFIARCLPSGVITYGYRYRAKGRQRCFALGIQGQVTPDQARSQAKRIAGEVASGRDPQAERQAGRATATNTVDALLDAFVARYVRHSDRPLRTADEIERAFDVYVRPRIGKLSTYDLTRRHMVELLDQIEDQNGPVMADRVLAYLRKCFRWQMTRDDRFVSPIVPGMSRTKPKERARDRTLNDDELRDLERALELLRPGQDVPACFPRFVRALLLSAQRRGDVALMHVDEIGKDLLWEIPGKRYKTKTPHAIPITKALRDLIGKPRGFVFSSDPDGRRAFAGFSKAKTALDRKIAELRKAERRRPIPHWTLHDLRRTARSLMSRAGVPFDIGERVLGHAMPGVRGVYDKYLYLKEKQEALEELAGLVERILDASPAEVVPLPQSA